MQTTPVIHLAGRCSLYKQIKKLTDGAEMSRSIYSTELVRKPTYWLP
jgi:hypothetical protein